MAQVLRPLERWASRPYAEGDGLHSDLFTAACFLLEEGHDEATIFNLLRDASATVSDREVPEREISSALSYAKAKVSGQKVSERWPSISPAYRADILHRYPANMDALLTGEDRLPQSPSAYLPYLYLPGELICAAADTRTFSTVPLEKLVRIASTHALEFVNPSPMSALTGLTVEGRSSPHCEANTGPRVYLVTEFDVGTPYEQASTIKYLSNRMPLVMVVYSGGKSIHGWFLTQGRPEHYVRSFFEDAVSLGADTVTWSRCQFCRMPGGRNTRTGKTQTVLYFRNPNRIT